MGGTSRRKAQPASQGKGAQPVAVQPPPNDAGEVSGVLVSLLSARSLSYVGNGGDYLLRAEGRPIMVTDKVDMDHFLGDPRCSCQLVMAPKRQKV